ncbi:unnamed protein product [Kuraishia capsulata CBS 1993]|uniref:Cytochrome b-c1 complex subunit 6, mitochondrial n=1 Tax=Kuraishia capsulata CBS 1993 TaxID=1382522 RepID=W6MPX1_9ASCO|nr:uncharacterized protein KUCA_T00004690001 [Kuraishia capsulata CBS 1993]CDK28706.1 unnamed protein product [Kuraishia capsulata CBS 1993]
MNDYILQDPLTGTHPVVTTDTAVEGLVNKPSVYLDSIEENQFRILLDMSLFRDLIDSLLPTVAYAEEPEEEEEVVEETPAEESEEPAEEPAAEEEEASDDEEEEEEDEDDDDEEEEDPMVTLRKECEESAACKPFAHHFHECVERVTKQQEEPGYEDRHYKEDCVEEFFHLQHCINDCSVPKLFYKLK